MRAAAVPLVAFLFVAVLAATATSGTAQDQGGEVGRRGVATGLSGTIAFVSSYRADPYENVIFEVSGRGGVRRIAGRDVSVSPDGKLRATVARASGGFALSIGEGEAPGERVANWKNGRNGKVLLAWSPDSDRLAAVGASSGSVDYGGQVLLEGPGPVWLVRSGGHPTRPLGRGLRASWSPRGTRLAVERTNGIDVRRSDGRLLRRIPRARDLAWSADDERSAYRIGRSTVVIADGNGKPLHSFAGPPGDIPTLEWSPAGRAVLATYSMGVGEVITSDGATRTPFYGIPVGWNGARPRKAPRNIEQLVTRGYSECWPYPSPNGLAVVVSGSCGGSGVYDAVSGRALLRSRVDEPGDDIRWSPNGKQLLQRNGNVLETISVPGGIRRTVATFPGDAQLAWARWLTDDRIAYRVSRHTFPRLHLLELRTLEAVEVGGLDVRAQPFYEDPWWSRDGTLLAARKTALRGSGSASVVVVGTGRGGSAERAIGGVAASNRGRATWSKDDAEIALVADEDNGVVVARRISDGSDRTIAEVPGALDVAWSPDGEQIAVATSRGVVVVRLDRPDEQRYVAPPLDTPARRPPIATPTWSPDGTRIAYTGPQGIVVATVDGGEAPAVLVRAAARPSAPTWSPDGQWIVLAANDPACTNRLRLIVVPAAGGAAQHLYRAPDCSGAKSPAWRP